MNMPDILEHFLTEMGFALLERSAGTFAPIAKLPEWFTALWGSSQNGIPLTENCPFLENFLFEAEAFWEAPGAALCQSETWVENAPDGGEIPLQARALLIGGKRVLAIFSPGAQFHEQVKMLQTARNALLDHERLAREIQKKEILLHCIVHDLSQPLSVMHVAMDCLSEEAISDRSKQFLTLGKLASNQQETMIRDILHTFSDDLRASLNAGTEENASADLLECARKTVHAMGSTFEAKRVRLALASPADAEGKWLVRAEQSRLERIFSNLLENALRYSSAGSQVTVGVESEREFLKAYVDDGGPGLPKDLRPEQIFGLFTKGKQSGGKAGLGLYFCRITVERWGGFIGCVSLPEKGSRFWFRIPRAAGEAQPAHPAAATPNQLAADPAPIPARPLRILFADDQPDIRTLTTHQLQRAGHQVVVAENGTEALKKIRSGTFDVILLDHEMPGMTGDQVAAAVRKREAGKTTRAFLIASTGNSSPEDVVRLKGAGFDTVLSKPFQLDDLYRVLAASSAASSAPGSSQKSLPPAQASFKDLLARVGGDPQLLGRMIRTFLIDTPKRMAAIATALRRKDAQALASLAHALKGSVSLFGAEPARKLAQDLQDFGREGDLSAAAAAHDSLKEEIANLLENLRGYAKQGPARPRSTAAVRRRPPRKRGKRGR
jgi:signal transduction histidine kinase/DNA-binding NarL/FixJ family response regulator